jgi:DNA-directed RNA polymerase subunit beta
MTPEEKLLRAIFGEKASDVRDTSMRMPPGAFGTVVEVRVFNRHGVEKDERAMAIEREEIERLAKDRDDEQAILDRNTFGRLAEMLTVRKSIAGPKGFKKGAKLSAKCSTTIRVRSGGSLPSADEKVRTISNSCATSTTTPRSALNSASWTRSKRCSVATRCRPA